MVYSRVYTPGALPGRNLCTGPLKPGMFGAAKPAVLPPLAMAAVPADAKQPAKKASKKKQKKPPPPPPPPGFRPAAAQPSGGALDAAGAVAGALAQAELAIGRRVIKCRSQYKYAQKQL